MRRTNAAARTYLLRQARLEHPDGHFDAAGRWHPRDGERCPCCTAVRPPSAAHPYTLNRHCRSAAHVAALYDVDRNEMLLAARALQRRVERHNEQDTAREAA